MERYNIQVLSLDTMDGTLQYTSIKSRYYGRNVTIYKY